MAATLRDVARESGLSTATVSKYINGARLKEKNRIAIERAIKKTGYTVNEYARGLKSNRSRTIGVVIPELSNLFVTQIITNMEEVLRAQGYSVIICDCHSDEKLECEAIRFLLGKRVDGIVNMAVCKDGKHLKSALSNGVPVVLVDRQIEPLSGLVDSVLLDNQAAAFIATDELLKMGHRKIGIVVGDEQVFTAKHRLRGYQKALEKWHVEKNPDLVVSSDYTVEGGYKSFARLVEKNPDMTAIFVTNYEMSLGAIIAANERGIVIPNELSFIGFDNMDLSRVTHPKLTVVTQPLEDIGVQTAKLLLNRLQNEYQGSTMNLSLSATLLHGNSVCQL